MKIELHYKNGQEGISNMLDTDKISVIEFTSEIKNKDTTSEIIEYIKELCENKYTYCRYLKYKEYSNSLLIYMVDGCGNKKFLNIEF